MNDNRGTYIQGLSLITSCGCNLNCSYCRISQSKNKGSAELQKNTIKALQDGSFLENVDKSLNRIGQSSAQISDLAFWGQEPTLTLQYITADLPRWFEYFPRWNSLMFSTNTIGFMDRIYDFIVGVDNNCKTDSFHMSIQFSYDGDYSTSNYRQGSSSTIHDNIINLIEKLNQTNLRKVKVRLFHHGVLSLNLLDTLQTPEAILEYSNHLYDWAHEFNMLNTNRNVITEDEVDIALENPVEATSLHGMKLANFCSMAERLNPKLLHSVQNKSGSVNPIDTLFKGYFNPLESILNTMREYDFRDLDQCVEIISKDAITRTNFFRDLNKFIYCGNGYGELKIMYDGTFINCQNHIFETDASLIHDENELAYNVKKSLATHNYFVNGITATEQQLDNYFELFSNCKSTSLEFTFQSVMTLMQFLVVVGQIDPSYRNMEKLVKHALILSVLNCCSYNNQVMTGSIFLRHTGILRLYCNGFLDFELDYFKKGVEGGACYGQEF